MKKEDVQIPSLKKLGYITRKSFKISQNSLIETKQLLPESTIPMVVEPAISGVNLLEWATSNKEVIETLLLKHRALLFRNFNINTTVLFNEFVKLTSSGQLLEYRDRSSPRHEVGDKIYTSTDYPAEQSIFLHNEGTYWLTWPLKIYFGCLIAAQQGGETPIADCRNIFQRIHPKIREKFIEKQVLYVRNYNDGFGLTWQTVFQTRDKAVVEEYCHRNAIKFEWKDGERLQTRQVRQAVAKHPKTGELVWFNHATFFHVSTLEPTLRNALLAEFREEDLPNNTYYGDGSPIEPEVLEELRTAYQQEMVLFTWQPGDLLMLDNMSVAHGRSPFVGQRKVVVGMADPFTNPLF
ncbi:TauD/TfdA family dioxygenase [Nostoc sp. UCD121]|uniref:TauD/TfdA family dioxygenase n=1 Tax=unclassified Nostoc TaxID=2593658 RepID=UPI001623A04A|nr:MULTISPECIES: TauD/TfdA family dioxygenase [unclassified Nostoc]MBC1221788.1 TauD/TfdA family dioxygenase [Nostoc sp. UCD120]MBC1274873.1 TauD/TfdA family dioxygenase [Nostoc sp. UCD121]MBC1293583.1 TauD/TfdA family dioxygenase [Nostoc sp. UCD122]